MKNVVACGWVFDNLTIFLASGDNRHQLITFANSLDPVKDRQTRLLIIFANSLNQSLILIWVQTVWNSDSVPDSS